jgi:hypothetical protein
MVCLPTGCCGHRVRMPVDVLSAVIAGVAAAQVMEGPAYITSRGCRAAGLVATSRSAALSSTATSLAGAAVFMRPAGEADPTRSYEDPLHLPRA